MFAGLDWKQVNAMRFSSLFQSPQPPQRVEAPAIQREHVAAPVAREPVPRELPEELDARVRLVGEWQLGEAA